MRGTLTPITLLAALALAACSADGPAGPREQDRFLDDVQRRTFDWFWDTTNPRNGLVAGPLADEVVLQHRRGRLRRSRRIRIGVERGCVTRDAARERVLATLRFLWRAPQGPDATGVDRLQRLLLPLPRHGDRAALRAASSSRRSTPRCCSPARCSAGSTSTATTPAEARSARSPIRSTARVDWTWAQARPPLVTHGLASRRTATTTGDWRGYNEAMILYILALGSPTHPIEPDAWDAWTETYQWDTFYGQEYVQFAPLFGHQYSHVWIDFRGIQDAYMRGARHRLLRELAPRDARAARVRDRESGRAGATTAPTSGGSPRATARWTSTLTVDGRQRTFHTYCGARRRRRRHRRRRHDRADRRRRRRCRSRPRSRSPRSRRCATATASTCTARYGFLDAFNPTLTSTDVPLQHGRVVPGLGWFDTDYLGIDQGPILAMIENYRSGLVWRLMREAPYIVRGLRRAGFTGGWLDAAGVE